MPTVLDMLPGKTHNNLVKVPSKRSFSVIGFLSSKIDKNIWSCWQNFLDHPLVLLITYYSIDYLYAFFK